MVSDGDEHGEGYARDDDSPRHAGAFFLNRGLKHSIVPHSDRRIEFLFVR